MVVEYFNGDFYFSISPHECGENRYEGFVKIKLEQYPDTKAAQIIGGLPVSKNIGTTLDIACGPFVFEDDGSFDIELYSI